MEGSVISRCSSMIERPNSNRQMGCSIPPAGSNSQSLLLASSGRQEMRLVRVRNGTVIIKWSHGPRLPEPFRTDRTSRPDINKFMHGGWKIN